MRRLRRAPLGRKAWVWLSLRTRAVLASDDPKAKAEQLWKSTDRHRYRVEVRATLLRMASGLVRCMYCDESAAHQIEHFWPKSRYPERAFCWENLLFVCGRCNGHKLAQFPLDERGAPLLIDPTAEAPASHLTLSPRRGELVVRNGSRKGRETIAVLKLNRWDLVQGRQNAWVGLQALLVRYAQLRAAKREALAERCQREILERPFSALLHAMLRVVELPSPERYLDDPDCLDVLRSLAPELRAWIGDAADSDPIVH